MGDQDRIVFRNQDTIGINDAEDDKQFLLNCFIDTGDYDVVKDFDDARCLILGRTGAGKTALLTKLRDEKKEKGTVIVMNPEALAMQHISNSTIIRFMYDLGIDMNIFFKLLWRHAVCVEIFSHHFKMTSQSEAQNLIDKLRYQFKKKNAHHLRALDYLERWQHTFWKKSDEHVTEMIAKKESEIEGSLGLKASALATKLTAKDRLSEEERRVYTERAKTIVDELQMREVADLLEMLNEVIEDQLKQYYVVVDKLDERWVDDELRHRLIKALIETVKDLNRFNNIKPLVVLRADLLGHVFELTKDSGFQEEKYSSLYLQVRWTRKQLTELIDKRIDYLMKSRYVNRRVTHLDILPDQIEGQPAIDYILDRTLMRPRDVIDFFNAIIRESADSPFISEKTVLDAARLYSRQRLDSLYYEWYADYPNLKYWVKVIREQGARFLTGDLSIDAINEKCLEYAVNYADNSNSKTDRLHRLASDVSEGRIPTQEFTSYLIHIFYTVGIIGLQPEGHNEPSWAHELQKKITMDDIDQNTVAHVHPCFASALNVV